MTKDFPQNATINIGKTHSQIYATMAELGRAADEGAVSAGLDPLLIELVRLRASQINGCAFCLRLHTHDALKKGETSDRLALLAAWWESDYFSPAERQALLITERVTNLASGRGDLLATRSDAPLTDEQISAVTWLAIAINAWNRVAVSSKYAVKP